MHSLYGVLSFSILLLAPSVFAQGPGGYNPIGPGVDLAGNWGPVMHEDAHERGPGPELANYAGIPITEGARMYGLAWDASRFTIPEHQCEVHILSYIYRGPYNLRIWEERDPVSQKLIAVSSASCIALEIVKRSTGSHRVCRGDQTRRASLSRVCRIPGFP